MIRTHLLDRQELPGYKSRLPCSNTIIITNILLFRISIIQWAKVKVVGDVVDVVVIDVIVVVVVIGGDGDGGIVENSANQF